MLESAIRSALPPAIDHDHAGEQRVEQRRHRVVTGPHVGAERRLRVASQVRHQAQREHRTRLADRRQRRERSPRRNRAVDDNGGERFADGSFKCALPSVVDLDKLVQQSDGTLDVSPPGFSGAPVVERQRKRLGARRPDVPIGVGGSVRLHRRLELSLRLLLHLLGSLHPIDQRPFCFLGPLAGGAMHVGLTGEPYRPFLDRGESCLDASELPHRPLDGGAPRGQLASSLAGALGRKLEIHGLRPRERRALGAEGGFALGDEGGLGFADSLGLGSELAGFGLDLEELARDCCRLGLERRDEISVEETSAITLDAAPPLSEERGETTCTLPHRLEPHQAVAEVRAPEGGESGLRGEHLDIERGELILDRGRLLLERRSISRRCSRAGSAAQ